MEGAHYGLHIYTGNGGNGESPTGSANGGRAGDVHLTDSHSTTNNVLNVWHIYNRNVATPVGEGPPPSGIYISCHFGGLELRAGSSSSLVYFRSSLGFVTTSTIVSSTVHLNGCRRCALWQGTAGLPSRADSFVTNYVVVRAQLRWKI
ncbi:hypothetical protein BS47DRAFT_561778 [Hydnum rufescens UP504]|uniref:Uncharacterized protein n=1 Tax=Hydnum rufescens UP504 TaxID=1448309 RepID=A0A9P6AG96_9AGAM|nr:hypothetical protein BS47DRAFT_561778 [Hydnum rufescens UP504]